MKTIVITLSFLQLFHHVSSTVFSAPHKLASLFKMEEELLDLLNNYSDTSEKIRAYLHSSQQRLRQISEGLNKDQVLVLNPSNTKIKCNNDTKFYEGFW